MALRVFQSQWAMEGLPRGGEEWSVAEGVARIAAAGFAGVETAWVPGTPAEEAIAAAEAAGLDWGVTCIPTRDDDFEALLARLVSLGVGPAYVNLQPNVKAFSVEEGAPHLRRWIAAAAAADVPLVVETHRDRMTTDLRFTLGLLDAVPELRLNADLSHYLVGQELELPLSGEDAELVGRILARADLFHGRVASREQVQVPIAWTRNRSLLELFLGWWEEGFRGWRECAGAGADLIFTTELGPPPYALTGADGEELSDRWEEALLLKREVEAAFERTA